MISYWYWYTWLGYFGVLFGLFASAILGSSPVRTAGVGLATGLVLVVLWNVFDPVAAPCLQNSKGWDILRAYAIC
jgi:hypothetical protein